MRLLPLLILAAGLASAASNGPLAICVEDRTGTGSRARAAFDRELSALAEGAIESGDKACSAAARIHIAIRTHAPSRYASALGLTYAAGPRVLPRIELYTTNLVRMLNGNTGSERFGRALARVAYHELQHYLRQETGHDSDGLFSPALNAAALLAPRGAAARR